VRIVSSIRDYIKIYHFYFICSSNLFLLWSTYWWSKNASECSFLLFVINHSSRW